MNKKEAAKAASYLLKMLRTERVDTDFTFKDLESIYNNVKSESGFNSVNCFLKTVESLG